MPGRSRAAPTSAVEPTGEGGMSAKAIILGACVSLWCCGAATADGPMIVRSWQLPSAEQAPTQQQPMPPAGVPAVDQLPAPTPIPAVTERPALPAGSVCSAWNGPGGTGCCGPIGGNGPIMSEIFLRNGAVLPVAGGIFNNVTGVGWMVSAGGRALFFNPIGSRALTAEFGIDYIYNNGTRETEFDVLGLFASIREHHRAGVHFAIGEEFYLFTPAYQNNCNWRVGLDVGGRFGAERVNFNVILDNPTAGQNPIDFSRRNNTYSGVVIAFHTDFEYPLAGCRTFVAGLRGEWSYNWSDIIPNIDTNEQDVTIMFTFGLKF
jgi:hypothetical protein